MKYLSYAFLALLTAFPFVSRASIASKLNDLEDCRVAITNAIVAKGGTASGALTNAAAEIAALPSGGGGRNWRGYKPPDDWPDIPQILEDNKEDGYQYAMAFLMDPSQETVILRNNYASKFKCSDGFVTTSSITTHTWADTGYHWCVVLSNNKLFITGRGDARDLTGCGYLANTLIVYGDGESQIYLRSGYNFVNGSAEGNFKLKAVLCDFLINSDCISGFRNLVSLQFVKGKVYFERDDSAFVVANFAAGSSSIEKFDLDFQGQTRMNRGTGRIDMFSGCYGLKSVDNFLFPTNIASTHAMFMDCRTIRHIDNSINLSQATSCFSMFRACILLESVFNDMDMKVCTQTGDMFTGCISLKSLPTNVTVNISMSFSQCTGVKYKQSVATFNAGGNVVGGFVGNLRSWDGTQYVSSCPNSGQTITLNSAIKALFTSTEQAAIVAALTAKNWTLAW